MNTQTFSANVLPWLTSDGIQLLGGVGYMEDYPQERRYRDAKQCEFYWGIRRSKISRYGGSK